MDSSSSKKLTCKTWGKSWKSFEDFCVGETHEAYEMYKFHLRRQELSETIEAYISSLHQLAKNCNFGVLEDRMIRDQVVIGIREDAVREKLLEDKKLDLAKCLELGRAYKTSRQQQSQSISKSNTISAQVNRIPAKQGNKPHGKWTTLRDFNVLETGLARNVHAVVKALCTEERTVQPKRRNAKSVLWRDTTQLCDI